MQAETGTYALVLENRIRQNVQIGRWREIAIEPGYYVYIGSAFGPGGVRARVTRHFRTDKKQHWHIDYLRARLTPLGAWVSHEPARLEHTWANALENLNEFRPVPGFGCSDCACNAHLFHTSGVNCLQWHLPSQSDSLRWVAYSSQRRSITE